MYQNKGIAPRTPKVLLRDAVACVLNRVWPRMLVAIDGSTYKYHPFFDHWVTDKMKELIDPGLEMLRSSFKWTPNTAGNECI
ncbi:hypothetical protein ANCDUO_16722 [Ancylostoma duodenale]|uniref:Uncharacterized protein n=1 Tax=Ancylostoma duodenale TaxID=51022 RepID=A0A0C2G2P7_9BILA|nr:hypothetical protein ANCDUO_16722 [Ancylostoma duodenale]